MRIGYRFELRSVTKPWLNVLAVIISTIAAFLISGLLIRSMNANVFAAFKGLFNGSIGSKYAILESLVQATPLIFTGLAMVVSMRSRFINLGVEGQFVLGAIAATWLSLTFTDLPGPIMILFLVFIGAAAGALYALIPAFLRAKYGISEIIVTVMMNYIVVYFLSWLLNNPWRPPGDFIPQTIRFAENSHWPQFFSSRLNLGLPIALLLAVACYLLLWKTPIGYEIRSVGENKIASAYKGINIGKIALISLMLSGAIAGIGGAAEVGGLHHRLRPDISQGYGWTGIMIALIGQLHPVGVVLGAIFFGGLKNGATSMKIQTGVPIALIEAFQGFVLIVLLISQVLVQYRIRKKDNG